MSQEEGVLGETNILIPVVEGEKKEQEEVHDAQEEKQQENRNNPSCQSVRVSLEACVLPEAGVLVEEKESTTAAAASTAVQQQQQQQQGGERGAAEELNVEIQQVERRRPIAHMTQDAAAVVPTYVFLYVLSEFIYSFVFLMCKFSHSHSHSLSYLYTHTYIHTQRDQ